MPRQAIHKRSQRKSSGWDYGCGEVARGGCVFAWNFSVTRPSVLTETERRARPNILSLHQQLASSLPFENTTGHCILLVETSLRLAKKLNTICIMKFIIFSTPCCIKSCLKAHFKAK